jgi:hypothetical protein
MNIEYVSIDKGEEAVHVTALVTEDKVTKEIRGSFNSLPKEELAGWFREQFYAPEVVEQPGEKVEEMKEPVSAYVADPVRVAACTALAVEYGKLKGKVVEQVEVRK